MSRRRGNSRTAKEARRTLVLKKLQAGEKPTPEGLGVHRRTLIRDLNALRKDWATANAAEFNRLRQQQLAILEKMEDLIVEEKIEPNVAREWRGVRADIAKLLGLNAESRVLHAHVSAGQDPLWLQFKKHADGLTDADLEKVWAFMDSLPRTPQATVRDASWYPEPEPKLLEGQ